MRRKSVLDEVKHLCLCDNRSLNDLKVEDTQDPSLLVFSFKDSAEASSFYDFIEFHIGTNEKLKDCLPKKESVEDKHLVVLEVGIDKNGIYA